MVKSLLLCSTALVLSWPTGAAAGAEFSPQDMTQVAVSLTLATTQEPSPGLPMTLAVTLRNQAARSITVPAPRFRARGAPTALDILLAEGDSARLEGVRQVVADFGPMKKSTRPRGVELTELAGAQRCTVRVRLSYDWAERAPRLLIVPGRLRLLARFYGVRRDREGLWEVRRDLYRDSDTLTIEVRRPTGDDSAAYAAVERLPHPWILAYPKSLEDITHSADFGGIKAIADSFPRSVYGVYAKAALAYMIGLGDRYDLNPIRPADPQAAVRLIDEVLADPRFVLREDLQEFREAMVARLEQQR